MPAATGQCLSCAYVQLMCFINITPVQVEKTVEKVLEEMKQKYQDALAAMSGAQANAVEAESDLDMIKQVQQQKMDEIKQLCQ